MVDYHTTALIDQPGGVSRRALAENRGPYVARNVGLNEAAGELITVQDSDDWAHPVQIARAVELIGSSGAEACEFGWVRMSDDGAIMVRGDGTVLHRDPTSLMFTRRVFETIGYFDSIRASGDSEYRWRIRAAFGNEALINGTDTFLAVGRVRPGSLTASGRFKYNEISHNDYRSVYKKMYHLWHFRCVRSGRVPRIPFPMTQRPFLAPSELDSCGPAPARENLS